MPLPSLSPIFGALSRRHFTSSWPHPTHFRQVHAIQRNVVALEPSIQFCFRRYFWWTHNYIHPAELPCETLVVLSGHDTVANPHNIRAALAVFARDADAHGEPTRVTVEWHEEWFHGGLHDDVTEQRRILRQWLTRR